MSALPFPAPLEPGAVRIALLEDNALVVDLIQQTLGRQGWSCRHYGTVADLLADLPKQHFDLLILDWSLPDGEADAVIRMVRNELRQPTPILIESINEDEQQVVDALLLGANDYVTKPLRLSELRARVDVLLRNRPQLSGQPDLAGYKFDPSNKQMTFGSEPLELTALEYDLACYFFNHRDQLLSREQLLRDVWQQTPELETRTVDAFVSRLRKKLRLEDGGAVRIRTLRGYGYRMEIDHSG